MRHERGGHPHANKLPMTSRLLAAAIALTAAHATAAPEQVLVLGAHHSGTSIASRALSELGLHLGDTPSLLLDETNPLKFWERRDVVQANQARLTRGTPVAMRDALHAHASSVPSFVGFGFEPTLGTPLNASADAREALRQLEKQRPWATKDPRLSLLAAEWLTMLERDAVCVITVRHPLDFASSMLSYSSALSLHHWTSIWLHYMSSAMRACERQPQAVIDHDQLTRHPAAALSALHARLSHLGVPLASPTLDAAALAATLGLDRPPPMPTWTKPEMDAASPLAFQLYETLVAAAKTPSDAPRVLVGVGSLPRTAWPALPSPLPSTGPATPAAASATAAVGSAVASPPAGEAYATLLTTDDPKYLAGALALASSIRAFDRSARPMLALVTPQAPRSWHNALRRAGWTVTPTKPLREFWWNEHPRCTVFTADQQRRWGHMATKLRLFTFTRYRALLYLDADALLTADPSSLFQLAEGSALAAEAALAPSTTFNAGVLLISPSNTTFDRLMERAAKPPPSLYGNTVDCTEQALLNTYFDGSTPERRARRFDVTHPGGTPSPSATSSAAALGKEIGAASPIVHWITMRCPKPWDYVPRTPARAESLESVKAAEEEEEVAEVVAEMVAAVAQKNAPGQELPAECDATLYEYWWRVYRRVGSDVLPLGEADGVAGRVRGGWTRRLYEYDGCSIGCPDDWLNDGACDASCNNDACNFDGKDCFHSAGECYVQSDGSDYRGKVAVTIGGRECQAWSAQSPNHHTMTLINNPTSGLGGHNFCRNPDGRPGGPWCYTLDFPNMRSESCNVGAAAAVCDNAHHAMPGGDVAPVVPKYIDNTGSELTLGKFVDGSADEMVQVYYQLSVSPQVTGLKVVLVPVNGDSDLFISFDHAHPSRSDAAFVVDSIGVKQFTLPRSNPHFCDGGGASCKLYLTVSGFEEGNFKLAVYNITSEPSGAGAASAAWSCSEGCDELRLGNQICDTACNTSACVWDQGDCGYHGEYALDETCSTGCATSWKGDGFCDEACFNAACGWDDYDCINADHGCADGCLPNWIDDEECDELCHNEACGWDGTDCDHEAGECYTATGGDYRGNVAKTKSGLTCQMWSHQQPQAHTFTHLTYPHAGLGGHNFCRNPDSSSTGPWCYTLDPSVPREACAVSPPQATCGDQAKLRENPTQRYRTLCPIDCEPVLGNGECEIRCNISSCMFDAGDCGLGKDLKTILADQGYVVETTTGMYVLVGLGVLSGVAIGLLVLRCTLAKLKSEERKRRGYTLEEQKGVDELDEADEQGL